MGKSGTDSLIKIRDGMIYIPVFIRKNTGRDSMRPVLLTGNRDHSISLNIFYFIIIHVIHI